MLFQIATAVISASFVTSAACYIACQVAHTIHRFDRPTCDSWYIPVTEGDDRCQHCGPELCNSCWDDAMRDEL